jgi:hypothetical protein
MSTSVSLFKGGAVARPSFLPTDLPSNLVSRASLNTLGFRGKVFEINANGEKHKLIKRDSEGDEVPLTILRGIFIGYNPERGRSFYPGAFDPDNQAPPLCWSNDGKKPDASIPEFVEDSKGKKIKARQSATCSGCPKAAKGSRISDNGKATVACGSQRLLALVPLHRNLGDLPIVPLRLKISVTSDWDKTNKEANALNWFAWQNYVDHLKAQGIMHSWEVITKIKFDNQVDYPKMLFHAERFITEAEWGEIQSLIGDDVVTPLINQTFEVSAPAGVADDGFEDLSDEPAAVPVSAPAPSKSNVKAAPVVDDEDEDEDDAPPPPKKVSAATPSRASAGASKPPVAPPKAAPVADVEVDDDDEDDAPPPPTKTKGKTKVKAAPAVVIEVDEDLAKELDGWDDEDAAAVDDE